MIIICTPGRKNIFFFVLALFVFLCAHAQKSNAPSREKAMSLFKNNSSLKQVAVNDYRITDAYEDRTTGIFLVYTQQMYLGIPVYNKISVYGFKNERLGYSKQDIVNIKAGATARTAGSVVTAEQAIQYAAKHLFIPVSQQPELLQKDELAKHFVYKVKGLAANSSTDLIWLPSKDGKELKLVWNVRMPAPDGNDDWMVRIDAQTGDYLEKNNLVLHETTSGDCETQELTTSLSRLSFKSNPAKQITKLNYETPAASGASYNVYPIPLTSPDYGVRSIENSPWEKAGDGNKAITNGWHFDGTNNYNTTRGNNVWAQADIPGNEDHTGDSDTSTTGPEILTFNKPIDFSMEPDSRDNLHAGIDNLFYWNNLMHDISYQYGFDEAAGNFQASNLGRTGFENDFVNAYSADGAGINNADMFTPPDGENPRMRMFLWRDNRNIGLHVNTPIEIADDYAAYEFKISENFTLHNTGPLTANAVLVNDASGGTHFGCDQGGITNAGELAGKIAIIDWNDLDCTYRNAILNCQNAGAIAVIIVGTDNPLVTQLLINLSWPGDDTYKIPVVFIELENGLVFKNNLSNLNITLIARDAATTVTRDGSLDNGVIAHEYTHGISNRLTGGPSTTACLINFAEQGGEGWSDYIALMATTNWTTATVNDGPKPRPMGTYALFQPVNGRGFRSYPYSTDMSIDPLSYDNLPGTAAEPHKVGEIWCSALWDMTWNIIQQEGIDADIYHGLKGNNISMQLVILGMKLQPCTPGFLDQRDAILKADSILYGYKHKCSIWNAFARRGMGYSASQGSSFENSDQVTATDLPIGMQLSVTADQTTLVSGQNVTYSIKAECNCKAINAITVVDTLSSANLTYVSSSAGGQYSAPVLSFGGLNFQPNETKIFTLTAKVGGAHDFPVSLINDSRDPANYSWQLPSPTGAGWVETTKHSHSSSHSWFADGSQFNISTLETGDLLLKDSMILSFWNLLSLNGSDAASVEITTDDGASWKDLGAYEIPNTAGGRITGTDNFVQRSLWLADFKDQTARIRFHYTGFGLSNSSGWYVDDIKLSTMPGVLNKAFINAGPTRLATDSILLVFADATALPVHFISFDAQKQNKSAALHWKVSNEINISKYVVERSADGINFSPIGEVKYINTSANEKDYYYTDNQPLTGNNYYRIAEKDLDGKSTLSVIKLLSFNTDNNSVRLSPVPTHNHTVQLEIESTNAGSYNAYLVNTVGQVIKTYPVKTGINTLDLQNFANGIYYLKVDLGNGRTELRKLVIE